MIEMKYKWIELDLQCWYIYPGDTFRAENSQPTCLQFLETILFHIVQLNSEMTYVSSMFMISCVRCLPEKGEIPTNLILRIAMTFCLSNCGNSESMKSFL